MVDRYLHPSGVVSYAVIRPPSPTAPCAPNPDNKLPILLALHGAGVEADGPQSKEQYNALPDLCSWLVLPSGVTSWSGDDWRKTRMIHDSFSFVLIDISSPKTCGDLQM